MNTYSTEFFSYCPSNDVRVHYKLVIQTKAVIIVEDLLAELRNQHRNYHEKIADELHEKFGGKQTLTAFHHGVLIESTRP